MEGLESNGGREEGGLEGPQIATSKYTVIAPTPLPNPYNHGEGGKQVSAQTRKREDHEEMNGL